jgi:hypothetical protein
LANTGVIPLRPLNLGDILSGAFRAVGFNRIAMLGLTFALVLAGQIITALLALTAARATGTGIDVLTSPLDSYTWLLGLLGISNLVMQAVMLVTSIVLSQATFAGVLRRKLTLAQAWEGLRARFWPVIGFTALVIAATAAIAAVWGALFAAVNFSRPNSGWLVLFTVVTAIPLALAAVWLGTRLIFAVAVISIENLGPIAAMRRSWHLSRKFFWRTFATVLLVQILVGVVTGTFTQIAGFTSMLIATENPIAILGMATFASLLASALTAPLTTAVTTLLYVDMRIRKEGLDIFLAQGSGL